MYIRVEKFSKIKIALLMSLHKAMQQLESCLGLQGNSKSGLRILQLSILSEQIYFRSHVIYTQFPCTQLAGLARAFFS